MSNIKANWQICNSRESFAYQSRIKFDHTLPSPVELKWLMAWGSLALGLIK